MRTDAPFRADDLFELERLYAKADAVVAMAEIAERGYVKNTLSGLVFDCDSPFVIGLRHDVDNFIAPAAAMAEWEAERGIRSTYFILHTAPYWQQKDTLRASLETIAECGHEIGFHVNAITESLRTRRDPVVIVAEAVDELRSYGFPVRGVVAHGDNACYEHGFVNDEIFTESPRPTYGAPDRVIGDRVKLEPISRAAFGFEYDPNWLPRAQYLSDSGGRWSQPFETVANGFPYAGQLHMLVHPDWWSEAFALEKATV